MSFDGVAWHSFFDELTKLAVSVDELQEMAHRLPIIRTKARNKPGASLESGDLRQMTAGDGPVTIPTRGQIRRSLREAKILYTGGSATGGPSNNSEYMEAKRSLDALKPISGTIATPAGGMVGTGAAWRRAHPDKMRVDTRVLSPEGKKALNLAAIGHEAAERSVPPHRVAPFFHDHISPEVLAKEHNMLTTLTGPGADEVKAYMHILRLQNGEISDFGRMLLDMFGERAAQIYGNHGYSPKIPKAMWKRLHEYY